MRDIKMFQKHRWLQSWWLSMCNRHNQDECCQKRAWNQFNSQWIWYLCRRWNHKVKSYEKYRYLLLSKSRKVFENRSSKVSEFQGLLDGRPSTLRGLHQCWWRILETTWWRIWPCWSPSSITNIQKLSSTLSYPTLSHLLVAPFNMGPICNSMNLKRWNYWDAICFGLWLN